jgi:hypothetical protein
MAIKSLDKSSLVTPQTTNSMLAGYSFQDYELIESVFLASATSSVTFNNLNQYATEYKHLQIRLVARASQSGAQGLVWATLNGDSGGNYSLHRISGTGSSVVSAGSAGQPNFYFGLVPAGSATANSFSGAIVDIFDAYSTIKNTTIKTSTGNVDNPEVVIYSGAWYNLSAINLITMTNFSGNFVTGSRFSLYGIR